MTLDATAAGVAPDLFSDANLRVLSERGQDQLQPRLERDLALIAERGGGPVDWRLRQIAYRAGELV